MTDSQRIKALIDYLKLSANKFAISIGVRSAGIYQIISGKYKISTDLADKIVRKYNTFNYDWLKNGKGDMLNSGNAINTCHSKSNTQTTEDLLRQEIFELTKELSQTRKELSEARKQLLDSYMNKKPDDEVGQKRKAE